MNQLEQKIQEYKEIERKHLDLDKRKLQILKEIQNPDIVGPIYIVRRISTFRKESIVWDMGLFSTKEKAEKYMKYFDEKYDQYTHDIIQYPFQCKIDNIDIGRIDSLCY